MDREWNDSQPIYRQLRDRVVAMILDGALSEGDALPSVRTVAAEYRVNPLTVLKGYQQLVDEGLVETRRAVQALRTDTLPLDEELALITDTHAQRYHVPVSYDTGGGRDGQWIVTAELPRRQPETMAS